MNPDPTLRADLMAFLEAGARDGGRVRLATPDFVPMCAGFRVDVDGWRCGADRDVPGQRYCRACQAAYSAMDALKRQKSHPSGVLFHTAAFQAGLGTLKEGARRRRKSR